MSPARYSRYRRTTANSTHLQPGQGVVFVRLDVEQLVQPRDDENLVDFRAKIAQAHLAGGPFDLLVEDDQLVEGGTGEELDAAEIQDEVFFLFLFDQGEELFAQFLDIGRVNDLAVEETDQGH